MARTWLTFDAEKYVLALRCLKAASAIDPDSPKVHEQVVALRVTLNGASDLTAKVSEVLESEFTMIDASADLAKFNEEFEVKHKGSARHALSAIKAKKLLGKDQGKCEKELAELIKLQDIGFDDAVEVLETLRSWRGSGADEFRKAAQAKWPGVTRLV